MCERQICLKCIFPNWIQNIPIEKEICMKCNALSWGGGTKILCQMEAFKLPNPIPGIKSNFHFSTQPQELAHVFLKMYFSKCISQNAFLKKYFSNVFSKAAKSNSRNQEQFSLFHRTPRAGKPPIFGEGGIKFWAKIWV